MVKLNENEGAIFWVFISDYQRIWPLNVRLWAKMVMAKDEGGGFTDSAKKMGKMKRLVNLGV